MFYSGGWEEYKKEVTKCAFIFRIFLGGDSVDNSVILHIKGDDRGFIS